MKFIKNIFVLFFIIKGVVLVFATDSEINIPSSNDVTNTNYFSTGGVGKQTKYLNKDNNSDIIGNYLAGYYYNKLYGFFKLDWSTDKQKNVRIIGSTSKCGQGYGYKFAGYAKSETVGLINFNYNQNTFVYYCMNDKKLYGKAFSQVMGYQVFDGISLEVLPNFNSQIINTNSDKIFVNNTTTIFSNNIITTNTNKILNVSGETQSVKYGQESVFYIWKPKNK